MLSTLVLAAVCAAPQSPPGKAQPTAIGSWHAWINSPGGPLPFDLEVSEESGQLRCTIRNGAERIRVPVVKLDKGELQLGIDYYDSEIRAKLSERGDRLEGRWTKRRAGTGVVRMVFHARKGKMPRFTWPDTSRRGGASKSPFGGRWRVQFEKDANPSVGVFASRADGTVTGTFLTTLGDYRFLAGNWRDRQMRLSCFDGAHAFLFHARIDADGKLIGDFWSSDTWHESFTGTRDPHASLPDAWRLTTADPKPLGRLRFPDLEGRPRALADDGFRGKARILFVFGSWCPNCRDASTFMAELDRRFRELGLSIVGLAFEHSGDRQRDTRQVRTYASSQGIEFPLLLAGLSDKSKASQALPILDRVRAYPTTVFLREDGSIRAVHTGFSGPGTGAEHKKLRRKFISLIEEMLGETARRR